MPTQSTGNYTSQARYTLTAGTAKSDIYPPKGTMEIRIQTTLSDVKWELQGASTANKASVYPNTTYVIPVAKAVGSYFDGATVYLSLFSATGGAVDVIFISA